jgi:hypothetical protein
MGFPWSHGPRALQGGTHALNGNPWILQVRMECMGTQAFHWCPWIPWVPMGSMGTPGCPRIQGIPCIAIDSNGIHGHPWIPMESMEHVVLMDSWNRTQCFGSPITTAVTGNNTYHCFFCHALRIHRCTLASPCLGYQLNAVPRKEIMAMYMLLNANGV